VVPAGFLRSGFAVPEEQKRRTKKNRSFVTSGFSMRYG
jgi:hypothetical protein